MARHTFSGFQGLPIRTGALGGTQTPAVHPGSSPFGGTIEKGFSSAPTASEAIALTPADLSAPVVGEGAGEDGGEPIATPAAAPVQPKRSEKRRSRHER